MDFVLDSEFGGHKDIILKLPGLEKAIYADSYYFCLDHSYKPEIESDIKGLEVLKYYCQNLLDTLQKSTKDDEFFFLLDLSDEYVGGLSLLFEAEDEVIVRYFHSQKFCGWQINLSMLKTLDAVALEPKYGQKTMTMHKSQLEFVVDNWILQIDDLLALKLASE